MINFHSIFRGFRRKKFENHPTLEAIVVESPSQSLGVRISEPTQVKEQVIDELPKIEKTLHGEELRNHLGYPEWFYASQNELKNLGIKGETQTAIARMTTPEQIRSVYSRLGSILIENTNSFVVHVPWVFTYKNSYLESYIAKIAQVAAKLYSIFGYELPKEFDWKYCPDSFKNLEALSDLEARLSNLNNGSPEVDRLSKLKKDLRVYEGKRILLLGVRTVHQEATLRKSLPSSTRLTFHKGDDIKGLAGQYLNYDVVVFTGGVSTHKIDMILKSAHGTDFGSKRINAYGHVNPERVLNVMAENSYRFS